MEKEIENTIVHLQKGETILYPTDTVWGIGCNMFDRNAVKKIYKIKRRKETKSFVVLVADLTMLKEYVELDEKKLPLLEENRPTTIIYTKLKNIPDYLQASDKSIAIRVPKDDFCVKLLQKFGKPIISTSANISGEVTPQNYGEINSTILRDVDYIVNWRQNDMTKNIPSKIIKIDEDNIQIIRE